MRRLAIIAGFMSAMVTLTTPLAAQIIRGVVVDANTSQPVADASVVLLDAAGKIQRGTLTEADGTYALVCPREGSYTVRVGGPGLSTWDSPPIRVGKDETVDFEIRAHREGAGVIEAFERRRASRDGTFLTAEEIEAKHAERFSEIFRHVAGVNVVPLPANERHQAMAADNPNLLVDRTRGVIEGYFTLRLAGSNYQAMNAGARQRGEAYHDCPPVLWVDGQWWGSLDEAAETGPDFKLLPSDIAAVEVYTPTQVPAELNSGRDAELCGVVSVWRK